jgi:hypothetical protein
MRAIRDIHTRKGWLWPLVALWALLVLGAITARPGDAAFTGQANVGANTFTTKASFVSFVQTVGTTTRNTSGNSSITTTVASAGVAAGHSVIVAITASTFGGVVACSDTKGNSYSINADVTGSGRLFICSAHNVTALTSSDTITATYPSFSGISTASANEFSGLASAGAVDRTSTASGNSANPSSGTTATTTQASEVLFGAIAYNNTPTFAAGGGYNVVGQVIGGSGAGQKNLYPEYQIVSSTGGYAATGTMTPGQQWWAAIVTYKAQ